MIEKKSHSTAKEPEKAVLTSVIRQGQTEAETREYLEELAFLATTANIDTMDIFTQKLEKPDSRTYVGKGKLEDIKRSVEAHKADMVIFDDDLSPAQVRRLEDELGVKILDRSLLILDIFSQRAQTAQAKAQVQLAQYQYLYPRLTGLWTHLSRQRGGAGMRGGPGETELETDRRNVKDRISLLKDKLAHIDRQSEVRRKNRDQLVRVAIVGYTNVGKSTLMNRLTAAGVTAENKLFATVDSTVRKTRLGGINCLVTDTVGFIRKLPTHLIEAFKSTLDEVREADVLMHVIDASSPLYKAQAQTVNQILNDIGAADKPTLYVYNKIDALASMEEGDDGLDGRPMPSIEAETQQLLPGKGEEADLPAMPTHARTDTVYISATQNMGIQELRMKLHELVKPSHMAIFPNYLQPEVI